MSKKLQSSRLDTGIRRGEVITFFLDGNPLKAYKGETIAAALMASGHLVTRTIDGQPLGVYCNIGVCHSCLMTVDGLKSVRICKTLVTENCKVETQHFERMQ